MRTSPFEPRLTAGGRDEFRTYLRPKNRATATRYASQAPASLNSCPGAWRRILHHWRAPATHGSRGFDASARTLRVPQVVAWPARYGRDRSRSAWSNIPVELLQRDAGSPAEVPAAAREGRRAGALRARLPDAKASPSRGRTWSRATSIAKGQFVVAHEGRLQDGGAREDEDDRHHRLRRSQGGRRAVFRDAVLPAGGQGGRPIVRAAARGDPRVGRGSGSRRSSCARRSISPPSKRSATRWCSR